MHILKFGASNLARRSRHGGASCASELASWLAAAPKPSASVSMVGSWFQASTGRIKLIPGAALRQILQRQNQATGQATTPAKPDC